MKLFKTHFSVIFSLFVLLCSFQFIVFVNKIILDYEQYLADDYSIVVVSESALERDEILRSNPIIKSISPIDSEAILKRLHSDMSVQNLEQLERSMPKFYTLKLDRFPNEGVANSLKNRLMQNSNIKQVEIFAKTYNKVYHILKLLNLIIFIFVAFAGLSALLLITKQMQIWTYEHQERMYVMNLFGASFWQKSSPLYKSAVLDAILAMLLAGCVFAVLPHIGAVQDVFSEIGVGVPAFVPHQDGSLLLVISLIVAIISTSIAMTKVKQV